ncbi:MAG: leucine-rich repeat domain-containing protein [Gammaproteobacteria bacterium]|nr:leucine-rich repeat domain-containing protein [Gammaproteobacteria bacterium]MCH9763831.1 leucine-rich repeat domain-containing protein [Gammaproteobacteria bacterium]
MKLSEDGRILIKVDPADIAGGGRFEIPDTVYEIGVSAFEACTGLTDVIFPDSLTRINRGAFFECTGLMQVTFPKGLNRIELGSFLDCTALTDATFQEGLTQIGYGAFEGCEKIKCFTFPESLTHIRPNAFYDCDNIEHIFIDTQNPAELNRIKALLPENLRSKAFRKDIYIQASTLRQEALESLYKAPEINLLSGAVTFFRAIDEEGKLSVADNADCHAAKDEMLALALPEDHTQFEVYKEQLDFIVFAHKPKKKEGEQAAEPEVHTEASNALR